MPSIARPDTLKYIMATKRKSDTKSANTKKTKNIEVAVAEAKASVKKTNKRQPMTSKQFNLLIALLHFVQGVVILVMGGVDRALVPITTLFATKDELALQAAGETALASAAEHLFDLPLSVAIASFFFVAALTHLLLATRYRTKYEAERAVGFNIVRSVGYAFTAGLMAVTVGLAVGVWSLPVMILILGSVVAGNAFHLLMDTHNRGSRPTKWWPYWLSLKNGLLAWVVIGLYILAAIVHGNGLPMYAYIAAGMTFVFFAIFAWITYQHHKKRGKWVSFMRVDKAFTFLNLVTAAALGWLLFALAII